MSILIMKCDEESKICMVVSLAQTTQAWLAKVDLFSLCFLRQMFRPISEF